MKIYPIIKRGMDIAGAAIGLILLCPIIIVIAVIVRIIMGSPVLFIQERPGYLQKPFKIIKFRTMLDPYDKDGRLLKDKERVTKFSRFLRKISLDEIPELWNVLKGDMSIVGPRPLLTKYLPYYTEEEKKRFLIRPGITGLAQVNGRNMISWEKRFKYDVYYYNNISLLLDTKIILKTFINVLSTRDIAVAGTGKLKYNLDVERSMIEADKNKNIEKKISREKK